MEGRFGFKDFVLLVAVGAVGVLVLLSMRQNDRLWDEVRELRSSTSEQQRQLARLERNLSTGVSVGSTRQRAESPKDDRWARPDGPPVVWLPPLTNPSDPAQHSDFASGGTFTEIFEAQFPNTTPFLYADVYGERIVENTVCESLAVYDPVTLELRAQLGVAYQYDTGGMWLRVRIRDEAVFSDGEPVTAEDVRYTFHDYVFNPEINAARFRSTLNVVDRVEAIDEKVVEFHFREPMFSNLDQAMRMVVLPKHYYERFTPTQLNQSTSLLVGSGPYRLPSSDPAAQWTPPSDLLLIRNERYWGTPPPFDQRRFTIIDDRIARLTAYENGQGDMMRATSEQYARKIEDPAFLERHQALAWNNMRSGYAFIGWNCGPREGKLTPFHDARVRLAMTHLMDRDRIVRDFLRGLGTVATGPFSPAGGQSDRTIKPWPYDMDRARALLDEAGWLVRDASGVRTNERGDRFVFEFTYATGSSIGPRLSVYLKDQCAMVGIVCEIRIVDWAIYDQILKTRNFDAITMQWSWTKPENDPYQLWHSSSIDNQGDNISQWSNPEADRLIEEGRRTIDREARMTIWHRLHGLIHEEQPYTFIAEPPWIRFIGKRIGNAHPYAIGLHIHEMYARPER